MFMICIPKKESEINNFVKFKNSNSLKKNKKN